MRWKETIKFAKSWVSNPSRMGTFLPLSPRVGKNLVSCLPTISEDSYILEIGSGTGSLTKFIRDFHKNIVCVEIDPELCNVLRDKFDDVQVINDSATNIFECIDSNILSKVSIIVSSVPFASINKDVRDDIFTVCAKLIHSGAQMLHASYSPFLKLDFKGNNVKQILKKRVFCFPIAYLHHYVSDNKS